MKSSKLTKKKKKKKGVEWMRPNQSIAVASTIPILG